MIVLFVLHETFSDSNTLYSFYSALQVNIWAL